MANAFHVALSVKDLPAAIEHYKKLLGIEPAKVKADYAKFEIADPPVILSLNPGHGESGIASHLGRTYAWPSYLWEKYETCCDISGIYNHRV